MTRPKNVARAARCAENLIGEVRLVGGASQEAKLGSGTSPFAFILPDSYGLKNLTTTQV